MPSQLTSQSVGQDVAKWLNLGGSSQQHTQHDNQQKGQYDNQQKGQYDNQQNNNQFNNNQQFMNNLITQPQNPGAVDHHFSPSNDNTGSGLDSAFSGIPLLQQASNANSQNNNLNNQFNNNTDPNERLKKIQSERGEIDNIACNFQNGNNFDPTKSPYENNKKFLDEEESKNSSVFFLKKK